MFYARTIHISGAGKWEDYQSFHTKKERDEYVEKNQYTKHESLQGNSETFVSEVKAKDVPRSWK